MSMRYFTKEHCIERYIGLIQQDKWSEAALWMALWITKQV